MQASFINTVLIIAKLSYYYNAVLVRNSPFDAHYWKAEALILVSILKSRIILLKGLYHHERLLSQWKCFICHGTKEIYGEGCCLKLTSGLFMLVS